MASREDETNFNFFFILLSSFAAPDGLSQTCSRAAKIFEIRPLPRDIKEICPIGYIKDTGSCIPNPSGGTVRFAIKQEQGSCPSPFTKSGSFCLSPSNYPNFIIKKSAESCPRGWVKQFNHYCLKPCPSFDVIKSRQIDNEVKLIKKLLK